MLSDLDKFLEGNSLSSTQQADLRKLLSIFFLGQIIGLPTLNSILQYHGIKSNSHQICYKNLCKSLTNKDIHHIFSTLFEKELSDKLKNLSQKDPSAWSRETITVVLDDSVFRTWLQSSSDDLKDYEYYYSKWFSGQFHSTVYGYKVVSLGLCIDGVFYPLYFELVKKSQETSAAIKVAQDLVEKVGNFLENLRKKGFQIPTIPFSCDNGYNSLALSETCHKALLSYISVPKRSEKIQVDDSIYKIEDYIENVFIVKEQAYLKKNENEPELDQKPFFQRVRATYCCQNKEVVLLFFRFNRSKKVSVIYCHDKTIFAKTLRHHWFQRTQIEQFFRLLKHTLQIAQAKTCTKHEFECKLLRFAWIALHTQLLTRYLRKRFKEHKKYGFERFRRLIISELGKLDTLNQLLK